MFRAEIIKIGCKIQRMKKKEKWIPYCKGKRVRLS